MPDKLSSQNLGERAASISGSVGGDVVTGSKTTAYDQRQQQVERQVNVAIFGAEAITARAILRRVFPAHSAGLLTTGLCD